jgi:hypothetical protein
MYWILRSQKGGIRFAAGTGARFAILDIEGKNVCSSTPNQTSLLFPKEGTPVFQSILEALTDETITIRQSDPSDSGGAPYQILISCGQVEIYLVTMNPNVEWIDEDRVLKADYTFKTITRVEEWGRLGKGVIATLTEQLKKEKRHPKAECTIYIDKKQFGVKINDIMKCSRKAVIVDSATKQGNGECSFSCDAPYLKEIADYNTGDEFVQIETYSENDTVTEKGTSKTVVVRYHAADKVKDGEDLKKDNESLGVSERFTIVFAKRSD